MKKTKEPKLKDRLEVGEELFCFINNVIDKSKVESVDKKTRTATLENQIIISRYPEVDGNFTKIGKNSSTSIIKRFDDYYKNIYEGYVSRKRVQTYISNLSLGLMAKTKDILHASPEELEELKRADKYISRIFKNK